MSNINTLVEKINMNVYIMSRYAGTDSVGDYLSPLTITKHASIGEYELVFDYVDNAISTFEFPDELQANEIQKGDFIFGKIQGEPIGTYFGIVEEINGKTVGAYYITHLANFTFPATTRTTTSFLSNSFEQYFTHLLFRNAGEILPDIDYTIEINDRITSTPHTYRPKESPSLANMSRYLLNAFRKFNIVWRFEGLRIPPDGAYKTIQTSIQAMSHKYYVKSDNFFATRNWDVSDSLRGYTNYFYVMATDRFDPVTGDPDRLYRYVLNKDNQLILVPPYFDPYGSLVEWAKGNNVAMPLTMESGLYEWYNEEVMALPVAERNDRREADARAIASEALSGNVYSHQIRFEMHKGNKLIDYKQLKIGDLFDIEHNGQWYNSVLTGYELRSGNEYITLTLGHVRYSFADMLD